MKKYRILLLSLFCLMCLAAFSQKQIREPYRHRINIGIKGGFNSSMYFIDRFKIQDITIDELQNNYKIGYFGSLFVRVNFHKHYLQPELVYNVSKSELAFDKIGSQHPDIQPEYATIVSTIRSVELPVLYGFKFINKGPYSMSFFVGPKIKYIWKNKSKLEFHNFDQKDISEELYPVNLSAILGLEVGISNISFDFRYEIGLHNISKSILYDKVSGNGQEQISNIDLRRRCNILSFSFGFIF